jgi:hypothetical protein
MKRLLLLLLIGCDTGVPPRGLVVGMAAPHTDGEARTAGCWLEEELSPALGRRAAEAGGFDSLLTVRGAPRRWVLVFEAPWIYGAARQQFSLHLRRGEQIGLDELVLSDEIAQGFDDIWLEEDGWIAAATDRIELPELGGSPLVFESVTFDARVLSDDRGLTIRGGALAGRVGGESSCVIVDVEPALIEEVTK